MLTAIKTNCYGLPGITVFNIIFILCVVIISMLYQHKIYVTRQTQNSKNGIISKYYKR